MKCGYVYIITNPFNTVFYTGVTSNLKERIYQHKSGTGASFTTRYNLKKLVWFDEYPNIRDAIEREKQIKNWRRGWKLNLIKELNPELKDLYDEI